MASWPPKKNAAFTFAVSLVDQSNTKLFKANPTLAAGDVTVDIDGAGFNNPATLPAAEPVGSSRVKVPLSSGEMNGDVITVKFSDAAGAEWNDLTVVIHTVTRQIDDLAYPTTSGRSIDVDVSGGVEVGSFQAGAIDAAAIATDAIDADALAANAIAEINATVDTALADYDGPTRAEATADADSILSKLLKYAQLIVRKDAAIATDNATELTAINANGGSGAGAFSNITEALEALRDRGDAAWITAVGFSTHAAADVWAVATRLLTAGTNIALAKGVGLTGLNDLSAAAINAEVDTALADYDGPTHTEMTAELATADDAVLAAIPSANANADALLDRAAGVETGYTPRQALRLILSALAGKLSGAATATVSIRDVGDTKDRITATVDADGNRSAVTLDGA